MSPRRNRSRAGRRGSAPDRDREQPVERFGLERTEEWRGEEWAVRQISGQAARKEYRCPGCDQPIPPRVAHVVVWPRELGSGVDDRRHWHRACWNARDRRGARLQRSRQAPRY
ncbi:ATP/GTP-binding protein [Streptomyces sp. NPDC005438]|uniref:ATP/GTP-binding protein n=1 Tax=Streptomyces sp. NPDC005438 TaxID=3156880 RepID=UPI0033AD7FFE